jgi:hypothetical protein
MADLSVISRQGDGEVEITIRFLDPGMIEIGERPRYSHMQ